MPPSPGIRTVLVYVIERHPLEIGRTDSPFQWIDLEGDIYAQVEAMVGPFDRDGLQVLRDKHPAGPAWRDLLTRILEGQVDVVVTHLAPLTGAQRQQLIGLCAQNGTRLITPGDAGRDTQGQGRPSC